MRRKRERVAIIGAGVVGRAIGWVLHRKGYEIAAVASRTFASARKAVMFIGAGRAARTPEAAARSASLLFITTPDRAIQEVCEHLAASGAIRRGACVFHLSGSLAADCLSAARERGAHVASIHPLQSFATPEEAVKRFRGTVFTFQGDETAFPVARRVVSSLGGMMITIEGEMKPLYHAASAVISNYLVAIVDLGTTLLHSVGMSPEQASRAALPLIKGTVENIERLGTPAALTGPIARGDANTIEKHLSALAALPPEIGRLYAELGRYTVRLARRKGTLDAVGARQIIRLLDRFLFGRRHA